MTSLINRACNLHRRTLKPWVVPKAFHVHPDTAERMDEECNGMLFSPAIPGPYGAKRLETVKGVAVVRDPRVPRGVIALQFRSTTGWPIVT